MATEMHLHVNRYKRLRMVEMGLVTFDSFAFPSPSHFQVALRNRVSHFGLLHYIRMRSKEETELIPSDNEKVRIFLCGSDPKQHVVVVPPKYLHKFDSSYQSQKNIA
jgi:hypothetical protein